MPESQICYLSELVERNLDEILQQTEFSLKNYVGLTPVQTHAQKQHRKKKSKIEK